ncbi:hypothetical protein NDU88_003762 [Pleurodeles waltl]|uniref:Uncharacterized protein n=1 Tax=Pleurodeles waltl TaxID=8319 RepID=A0AAV7V1J7_PLEWA|nr:hypothetical protein NDU88_003762 [Pleurodeles waltl]
MSDSATRGEKRSCIEELLDTLMLRMDAIDQATASLRAQLAASSEQAVRPKRASAPPKEAFPPSQRGFEGQKKGRKSRMELSEQGQSVSVQAGLNLDNFAAPMTSQDQQATPALVDAIASAMPQVVVGSSQVPKQTAPGSALVPTVNSLPVVPLSSGH